MARLHGQLGRRIRVRLAAVLIVSAVCVAAMWVISYATPFWVHRDREYAGVIGGSLHRGRLWIGQNVTRYQTDPPPGRAVWRAGRFVRTLSIWRFDSPEWLAWIGIDWRWKTLRVPGPYAHVQHERNVCCPLWLPAALAAASGVLLGRPAWTERRRLRGGLCPTCGYDLRMSPQRCPECGSRAARGEPCATA